MRCVASAWGLLVGVAALEGNGSTASALNRVFRSNNLGVLYRGVSYAGEGWWDVNPSYPDRLSFMVVNHFARSSGFILMPDSPSGFGTIKVGMIASPSVIEHMITAFFPCDGSTNVRANGGAGCHPKDTSVWKCPGCCTQPDRQDWCDGYPQPVQNHGALPCAYKQDELQQFLQKLKQLKTRTASPAWVQMCSKWAPPQYSINEAVVNGTEWSSNVREGAHNILAFEIPQTCKPETSADCYRTFYKMYAAFQAKYGDRPIVTINSRGEDLFSDFPSPPPKPDGIEFAPQSLLV